MVSCAKNTNYINYIIISENVVVILFFVDFGHYWYRKTMDTYHNFPKLNQPLIVQWPYLFKQFVIRTSTYNSKYFYFRTIFYQVRHIIIFEFIQNYYIIPYFSICLSNARSTELIFENRIAIKCVHQTF